MKLILSVFVLSFIAAVPVFAHSPDGGGAIGGGFRGMERMMDRANEADDPETRRRFLREHMDLMGTQLGMMHQMMEGHRDTSSGSRGMSPGTMNDRVDRMEQRMDMMQRIMEQMFEQQDMMMRERER